MDLLENLLVGRGCSTDGQLTRNPITSMIDSVFNSHVAVGQQGMMPSSHDEKGYYMEQPYQQQTVSEFQSEVSCLPHNCLLDFC